MLEWLSTLAGFSCDVWGKNSLNSSDVRAHHQQFWRPPVEFQGKSSLGWASLQQMRCHVPTMFSSILWPSEFSCKKNDIYQALKSTHGTAKWFFAWHCCFWLYILKKKCLSVLTWSLTGSIWNWKNIRAFSSKKQNKCTLFWFHQTHIPPPLAVLRTACSRTSFRISVLLSFSGHSLTRHLWDVWRKRQTGPESFWDQEIWSILLPNVGSIPTASVRELKQRMKRRDNTQGI